MDVLLFAILITGFPFAIASWFFIRKWAKLQEANQSYRPDRRSYRADLINSFGEKEMRAASDAAVIASGIVAGTVIHS